MIVGGDSLESAVEMYLHALDDLTGAKGEFLRVSADSEHPAVWVFYYRDVVEAGSLTAFTYGLSAVEHAAWRFGRPELILHVKSSNTDWAVTLGNVVRRFRGICAFSYGDIVRFGRRITFDSEMSAFFVFAPTVLDKDAARIELPDRIINLVQVYPIYEREIPLIESVGPTKFFLGSAADFSDLKRSPTPGLRAPPEKPRPRP